MSETAGGLYTEELFSMGVWMGERRQAAGSGAHYLHGNLYHWGEEKKSFSVRQAQFYNRKRTAAHTDAHKEPENISVMI